MVSRVRMVIINRMQLLRLATWSIYIHILWSMRSQVHVNRRTWHLYDNFGFGFSFSWFCTVLLPIIMAKWIFFIFVSYSWFFVHGTLCVGIELPSKRFAPRSFVFNGHYVRERSSSRFFFLQFSVCKCITEEKKIRKNKYDPNFNTKSGFCTYRMSII